MQNKKGLVKELKQYHKALNVPRLHDFSDHKDSKDWLAEVAAILKNLDESDYQEFMRLRKSIYPGVDRRIRINAANEIDCFVRQKVAGYKRYDFGQPTDIKEKRKREICIPIPEIKTPEWIRKHLVEIIIGIAATVFGGLILYYFFGIK